MVDIEVDIETVRLALLLGWVKPVVFELTELGSEELTAYCNRTIEEAPDDTTKT